MYKNTGLISLLLFCILPFSSSYGNSLFSAQNNVLYVPFLNYQGQNFQAKFSLGRNNKLQLLSTNPRDDTPIYGKSIALDKDLNFTLAPINFNGQQYTAQISHRKGKAFHLDSLEKVDQSDTRRGTLVSATLVNKITPFQLNLLVNIYNLQFQDAIKVTPLYEVLVYSVAFQTLDPSGELIQTSALIAFPDDTKNSHPLISYQHGTEILKENAPSVSLFDIATASLASSGYVVVSADYIGLREPTFIHPFVHAHSLATTVIDALRATRLLAAEKGIRLNKQLFLAGYSEGGYATMAAHREIQTNYSDEFSVTASAPMAGPFALSKTMVHPIINNKPLPSPYFIPYAMLAYNQIYGYMEHLEDLFQPPYAEEITQFYDGLHTAFEINNYLPEKNQLYTPFFFRELNPSHNSWIKAALQENDIYRWKPEAPMYLLHCVNDEKVPYQNSQIAYDYFQSVGATQVQLLGIDDPLLSGDSPHNNCSIPLLMKGKTIFDALL